MSKEQLHALLKRLNGEGDPLTGEELGKLHDALLARTDELLEGERTAEVKDELVEIATAKELVTDQQTKLDEQAAALEAEIEAALSRIRPASETEPEPEPETAEVEEPAAEVETSEQAEVEEPATEVEPEPVVASTKRVDFSRMNAAKPRSAKPAPKRQEGRALATLTALEGGRGGVARGDEVNWEQLAEIMADRLTRGHCDVKLAHLQTKYPEDRTLHERANAADNQAKIDALVSPEALTAAGGICAPIAVDYTVPVFGATTVRPLRDALPRFGADRGGIRFITPPGPATPSGSVGVWTAANDAAAATGSNTKAIYRIVCAAENTVLVEAITTRLLVGNMQGRFSPELVQANTKYALAYASATAELELWKAINAASTRVSAGNVLGASRDLLEEVGRAATAVRYRFRMSPTQQLRAIFPDFVREMIRSDILREQAHDAAGYNSLAVSDAQISAWFAARNITETFVIDTLPAATANGITSVAQGFTTQASSSGSPLQAWPLNVAWNLFAEGSFQFLDGGSLDLGVVRDSTLDATNDYETFVESFEGVAFRGVESLQIVSTVNVTGSSGRIA
jgi:outer membrane biosynthesis protein TonB